MGFFAEFKKFALKGNVVDLAIAVIIGAAFGKIVTSVVDDIIMPLINPLMPGGEWQSLVVGPGIKIGSFLAAVVNFIIIALAVFLLFKAIQLTRKKEEDKPPTPSNTEVLLTEIRDLLRENPRTPVSK
jgi:large conductance mechanosensitive channel